VIFVFDQKTFQKKIVLFINFIFYLKIFVRFILAIVTSNVTIFLKTHQQYSFQQSTLSTMELEDILILYIIKKRSENINTHSRYKKLFYKGLRRHQRRLRDRRIPHIGLHHPCLSAWCQLINSGNNQALITLTGLDFPTLLWLNNIFIPIYDNYSSFVSPDGSIVWIDKKKRETKIIKRY
jgi:hypothetical protein